MDRGRVASYQSRKPMRDRPPEPARSRRVGEREHMPPDRSPSLCGLLQCGVRCGGGVARPGRRGSPTPRPPSAPSGTRARPVGRTMCESAIRRASSRASGRGKRDGMEYRCGPFSRCLRQIRRGAPMAKRARGPGRSHLLRRSLRGDRCSLRSSRTCRRCQVAKEAVARERSRPGPF